MPDRIDLESAIMDAEGAAAVLCVVQMELTTGTHDGWRRLGLKPRDDLYVLAMSPSEIRALNYAMDSCQDAVAEVSRVFYAYLKERQTAD